MDSFNTTSTQQQCLSISLPLLSLGPFLALLYTLCVYVTYAINGEIQWTSNGKAMSLRLSLLVVSVAIGMGMCREAFYDNNSNSNVEWLPYLLLTVATLVLGGISVYNILQTRQHDVVGIPKAPFFGTDALKGKLILISGANNGIGKETAYQLAAMGATVVLLCRSVARAEAAVREILERRDRSSATTVSSSISKDQLVVISLDLGDFSSIRQAVAAVKKKFTNRSVDVLINNAGLMMGTQTQSKDGLEMMMQANHLGHFLLTRLLLEENLLLLGNNNNNNSNTPPSRVINLTSSTYRMSNARGGFDFDDVMCERTRPYTLFGQYSMTKLANILFTKELSRKYPQEDDLKVFAVHPGIVRTNVTSNMNWYWRIPNDVFAVFVAALQKTPAEGAYSTVFVAAAPDADLPPNGSYIVNCQATPTLDIAESVDDADRLWKLSEELVGWNEKEGHNQKQS